MDTCVEKLEHLTCPCGRPGNVFKRDMREKTTYYVESHCCGIRTVALRDKQRAINMFASIIVVLNEDEHIGAMP